MESGTRRSAGKEDVDWPFQKADVKVLRAAWNEWKKRGKAA
jgi:hypothetical protein